MPGVQSPKNLPATSGFQPQREAIPIVPRCHHEGVLSGTMQAAHASGVLSLAGVPFGLKRTSTAATIRTPHQNLVFILVESYVAINPQFGKLFHDLSHSTNKSRQLLADG